MTSQIISANEIRTGNILEFDKKLWIVLKHQHVQPGKGGAFVQVEMKSLKGETKLNQRFRSEVKINKAFIEEEEYQYSFHDEKEIHLLNLNDFTTVTIPKLLVEEKMSMLTENIHLTLQKYKDEIIAVKLPDKIKLRVKETEPYIKGQTATATFKPAIMEGGLRVMVPPFIKPGDLLLINTEDSSYCERTE